MDTDERDESYLDGLLSRRLNSGWLRVNGEVRQMFRCKLSRCLMCFMR